MTYKIIMTLASLVFSLSTFALESDFTGPADCAQFENSLPNPNIKAGTSDKTNPIEHILIIMQENRSFDHYFGGLSSPEFYGDKVDGTNSSMFNLDSHGNKIFLKHEENICSFNANHSWDGSRFAWNNGKNDQFVILNESNKHDGNHAMSYFNQEDIPFYYSLANQFAIADRYFSSVMGPTLPNRFYLWAGSSFGVKANPDIREAFHQKTIFDVLNEHHISWKYYYSDLPFIYYFRDVFSKSGAHIRPMIEYYMDLKNDKLPQIVFLESGLLFQTEEAPRDLQFGQYGVARRVNALLKSKAWSQSALLLTYDEGGGLFDHVAPPKACAPDAESSDFDQLGFRVPFVVVSPFVKRHYVSHVNYDHTSILKFIENKYNLPALSRRDANANSLDDFFDFQNPNYKYSKLADAKVDWKRIGQCFKQ